MKTVKERLFNSLDRKDIGREVEEELRFHLDLLTDEHCRPDMPREEAIAMAQKRFGDVEQIRDQCVEISRKSHPAIRALKLFLAVIFLVGVLVHVFSPEYHLTRVGDVLMMVGVLGRMLLYVRGLNPSSFISKPDDSSPLKLVDSKVSFTAYDQRRRTPLERIISDK
jgi:hypothetical protein